MSIPRQLPVVTTAYRIGDAHGTYPVYSAEGARRSDRGRWHQLGDRVIYASEHYSTAMLETLVRWSGDPPDNQHYVEITIPSGISYEVVTQHQVPGWHKSISTTARRFGHQWYVQQRSTILIVPSVVARLENNIILNTTHAEFARIVTGLETPVWWDARLFR